MSLRIKKLEIALECRPLTSSYIGKVSLSDGETSVHFDLTEEQISVICGTAYGVVNDQMEALALKAARFKRGQA